MLSSAGGSVSEEWAPRFVEAGAVVVDNTSFWRMHDDVPLVVAEVNPEALDGHRGIVANPNCSAMQMLVALGPLHTAVGLERIVVSTYQPVSGTGRRAMQELEAQTDALLHGSEVPPAEVYPHRIAFNILPQVETFKGGDDYTTEERKMMAETRKILGASEDELGISATCVRVPVLKGESESVNVQTREPLSPRTAGGCWRLRRASWSSTRPATGSTRWPPRPRGATRCSSGASVAIPPTSAASTCGSSATTCARARRRTPSRSPSSSTSASSCGCPRAPE